MKAWPVIRKMNRKINISIVQCSSRMCNITPLKVNSKGWLVGRLLFCGVVPVDMADVVIELSPLLVWYSRILKISKATLSNYIGNRLQLFNFSQHIFLMHTSQVDIE